jgi:two-component system NarL family sensor kinase
VRPLFRAALIVATVIASSQAHSSQAQVLPESREATTASSLKELGRQAASEDAALARGYYREALSMARADGDSAEVASILKARGNLAYFAGNFTEAQEDYLLGYEAAAAVDAYREQAGLLNELGTLYKRQGDLDASLEYYRRALDLSTTVGDTLEVANSMNNMGIVFDRKGDTTAAMRLYQESAALKESVGDLNGLTYNLDNMGIVSSRMGQFADAERFFGRAASIRLELGDRRGYGIVQNNLGEMFLAKGEPRAALGRFEEALSVARETGFTDFERHVLGMISSTYETRNDFQSAMTYYREQVALSDSLYSAERSQQLLELRETFEAERRENTIAVQSAQLSEQRATIARNYLLIGVAFLVSGLLAVSLLWQRTRQNLRLRQVQASASIESQEAERSRIAQDLHDGLGQMIVAAKLSLTGSVGQTEGVDILDDMYGEMRSIAFNLMPKALSQGLVADALGELAQRTQTGGGPIMSTLHTAVPKLSSPVQFALYRIAQEWLNNLLRHGLAEKVVIQLVGHESELVMTVEDDGPGFDTSMLETSSGNGWMNIQNRIGVIGGTALVDSRPNHHGSTLIVTVPLSASAVKTAA